MTKASETNNVLSVTNKLLKTNVSTADLIRAAMQEVLKKRKATKSTWNPMTGVTLSPKLKAIFK